ncbi:MAG TPA: aldehyde dehydrogenase family protein, partial [Verrucomicrobiota bacterium]|nr:aldehyde dehydrogenase family protein [Verrucomicrobiota bacterium]
AIDIGKPLQHGFEEVRRAAENIRDVHRRAADPRSFREQGGLVRRVPCGVIALITPWNNPVAIALGKIAPALAYGNVVVWKPAPAATRIAQTLLSLLLEAGVPHGAVCLLPGDHRAALELIAQDSIDAVTFTGSRSAGYAVQERCARRLVPLQAELSGNNAAIVWTDGDLSPAALEVARGAFGFAGQRCTANRRAIVPASRVEEFAHELKRAGEQLAWGDPLDPAVEIGPMINTEQRDRATALIESERARVRRIEYLHAARAREPWTRRGAWMQPVIVCCDAADSLLAQEEMMAPVLVVQGARDFDHAIDLCNGVRHGLAAALFSDNADLQRRFLADARAGILKLNASTAGADVTLPFGGWKESGCGPPEHGEGDVLFYTRLQAVYGMPTQAGHNGAQQLRALTP